LRAQRSNLNRTIAEAHDFGNAALDHSSESAESPASDAMPPFDLLCLMSFDEQIRQCLGAMLTLA
jgi:hypothetical protein